MLRVEKHADFNPQHYDVLVSGNFSSPHTDNPAEQEAYAKMHAILMQNFSSSPLDASKNILYVDLKLYDFRPVKPALNVLSSLVVFLPLDQGALTIEASFRDINGEIMARRTQRLFGGMLDVRHSFSRYGRLNTTLMEWGQQCNQKGGMCALEKSGI